MAAPMLELSMKRFGITDHALQRLRKRVGIPKKAAYRHVQKVLEKGVPLDAHSNGQFRRWAKEALEYYPDCVYIEYNDFVYVFSGNEEDFRLVTVLYPPNDGAWEN